MKTMSKPAWLVALIALAALSAVEVGLLAGLTLHGGQPISESISTKDVAVHGSAVEKLVRAQVETAIDASSVPRGKDETVDATVKERLGAMREKKRERFIGALVQRVETKIGRTLTPVETNDLLRSNREYFLALDERGENREPEKQTQQIGTTSRARVETLFGLVRSEEDAARLLAEAMNAMEAEPVATTTGSAAYEAM